MLVIVEAMATTGSVKQVMQITTCFILEKICLIKPNTVSDSMASKITEYVYLALRRVSNVKPPHERIEIIKVGDATSRKKKPLLNRSTITRQTQP
jgi:hypothetical protein